MNRKAKQLNRINNELDKQINSENQEIFTDMICYLRCSGISEYDQEIVRQDLSEMVISAQSRGENIHSVIGGDYKAFCDNVISSLPLQTATQKLCCSLSTVCLCASILITINTVISTETVHILRSLFSGAQPNFNITFSQGSAALSVFVFLAAVLIVKSIAKNAFQTEHKRKYLPVIFGALFGVACWFILSIGKAPLLTVNIFAALIASAALFGLHKLLEAV